eukprot:gb/GECG01001389.1/.p1 GENE.gb/GECG01001389.1/~~gb/GECG01001389.1/.p1  ORF type:complete len:349 (+),score=53.68 gb/GECG01001389.1/:1-1047(+)
MSAEGSSAAARGDEGAQPQQRSRTRSRSNSPSTSAAAGISDAPGRQYPQKGRHRGNSGKSGGSSGSFDEESQGSGGNHRAASSSMRKIGTSPLKHDQSSGSLGRVARGQSGNSDSTDRLRRNSPLAPNHSDTSTPLISKVSDIFGKYDRQLKDSFASIERKHEAMQQISHRLDNQFEDFAPEHEFNDVERFLDKFPKAFAEDAEVLEDMQKEMQSMEDSMTKVHEIAQETAKEVRKTMDSERDKHQPTKFMSRLSQRIESPPQKKPPNTTSATRVKPRRSTSTGFYQSHRSGIYDAKQSPHESPPTSFGRLNSPRTQGSDNSAGQSRRSLLKNNASQDTSAHALFETS